MARIDDLIKEQEKKLKPKADADIAEYTKENNALKDKIHASLDASAESQAGVYRQDIEQAPLDSRIQYDKNAMQEAVDRKKIAESLANMGMTDSGLSSSMQTALTVQKSRADNKVRVAEQQRIRAAESMIDQIFANNELQKAQKEIEIDQDTAAYARARRESDNTLATQTATSMYNAEVEAAATRYAAEVEAKAKAAQAAQDYRDKRAKIAQDYINKGIHTSEAWAQAYAAYPDNTTSEGVKYAYYAQLRKQGYGVSSAEAMSSAYVSTTLAGGKSAQVNSAVDKAMSDTYEKELGKHGLIGLQRMGSANEMAVPDVITSNYQSLVKNGISAEAAAYAVGCQFYNSDESNANNIGQALEQCFNGVRLNAALLGAGLEY